MTPRWKSSICLGATSTLLAAVLNGCIVPSVYESDKSVGPNYSFEIVESGLPVNWYFSQRPVTNGSMEIVIDTTDAVEGSQSLKVIVHRVDSGGGSLDRPWLFSSHSATPGASYKVSFWLKNQGCIIGLGIGNEGKDWLFPSEAIKQDLAAHPPISATLGEEQTGTNEWRRFEYIYAVPGVDGSIRLDIGIKRPGTLWIDDVRIEEVPTG